MRISLPMRADGLAFPSRRLLGLFRTYLHWYVPRHFHGVRIAHVERCPQGPSIGGPSIGSPSAPLIVYLNHPSWWDPLTGALVSHHLYPDRDHYTPMDEQALAHYNFFRRLGVFPVELGTRRGAAQFLRSTMTALTERNAVLWLTPQSAFTDVRARPLAFRRGLAALAARVSGVTVLPIAIEYTYWNERLPEILVNIGEPLRSDSAQTAGALEAALTATLEELAALGMTRDQAAFQTLLRGSSGTGGVYDPWQRLRALLRGRKYRPEHGDIHRP